MIIYKFGGASVESAEAVKNLAKRISECPEKVVIVVSAMGKNTNALEGLLAAYFENKISEMQEIYESIKAFHLQIVNELFPKPQHPFHAHFAHYMDALKQRLKQEPSLEYDFEYDQIISFGELFSTLIVSTFLNRQNLDNEWIDVRKCLRTDTTYREAGIDWDLSDQLVKKVFTFENCKRYVTQGFIASTSTNITTTLGREGSDFTAAALAYFLNAEKVVIWKDVAGIYNADPKWHPAPKLIKRLSYHETIELAYFGAKVIHSKTIKPLQNKRIPLFVRSFSNPGEGGSLIKDFSQDDLMQQEKIPVFIKKPNQILISISPEDFSFIAEKNLSKIFGIFANYNLKINMMQNSAISFSVSVDNRRNRVMPLLKELKQHFKILYNENLTLITIRNYTDAAITEMVAEHPVLLEQKSRTTAQFIIKE